MNLIYMLQEQTWFQGRGEEVVGLILCERVMFTSLFKTLVTSTVADDIMHILLITVSTKVQLAA